MTTQIQTPIAKFSEEDAKKLVSAFSDVITEGRERDREIYFLEEATAVYNALRASGLQIPPADPRDDAYEDVAVEVSGALSGSITQLFEGLLRTIRFDQQGHSNYFTAEELLSKRYIWFIENEVYLNGAMIFGIERRILPVAGDPFTKDNYGEHIYAYTITGPVEVSWDTVFVINPHAE